MKRSYLTPLTVLAVLLAFSIWNSSYMKTQTLRWSHQLDLSVEAANQENWGSAHDLIQSGYQDWSSYQTYLHIVTQHGAVDEAESMYHRAMAFAVTEEITEFQAEIADLQDQLRLLSEMERFSLGNILTSLPAAYSALP